MEVVSPVIASPDNRTHSVISYCMLGSHPSLRLPRFPLSCSKARNWMLRVACRLVCFAERLCVGRGGELSAATWTVAFHHTDQPALIYGARQPAVPKRTPARGACPPCGRAAASCPRYPCIPSLCSGRPPSAQPMRRWPSPQAPANPRPAFAGNAKPLGEKQ